MHDAIPRQLDLRENVCEEYMRKFSLITWPGLVAISTYHLPCDAGIHEQIKNALPLICMSCAPECG